MSEVFGHKYELYITQPSRLVEYHNSPTPYDDVIPDGIKAPNLIKSSLTGGYIDYLTVDTNLSLKITDPIQLTAEVSYQEPVQGNKPQKAKINLYNLSQTSIERILTDATVLLNAGYEQDAETLPTVFVGNIEEVHTQQEGSNLITTLTCIEGNNPIKSIRYVQSFPENRTYKYILSQMIKVFKDNGVPLGQFIESDRTIKPVKEPTAYSGKLSKVLTDLCLSLDYIWYINGGKLYILPKDEDRPTDVVTLERSSIIGKLSTSDSKEGKSSANADVGVKGVKFKTFLNGDVRLGTYIKIPEGSYEGNYKINKLRLSLNWQEGPWDMDITTKGIKKYG